MSIVQSIYKSLFKKNYQSVWQTFSLQNNGLYSDTYESVALVYENHTIIFDTYINYSVAGGSSYEKEYTRVRMEFSSSDTFKLKLMKEGIIDFIGKLFGAQDIKVGNDEFDREFIIKGNDEIKTQLIFADDELRNQILDQKNIDLHILDEGIFGEQVSEGKLMLYYISSEKITNTHQLEDLFQLYKLLFKQLKKVCIIA